MKTHNQQLTIPLTSWKAWVGEFIFWALAILVPLLGHLFHWNVRAVLPMHWVILLTALVYGQIGGFLAGALSPALNTLLTGMPAPAILPVMTLEISTYGLVAGSLREKAKWNSFLSVFVALLAGRMVFLGYAFVFRTYQGDFLAWAWKTLQPGLLSAALQVLLLPFLAWGIMKLFVKKTHA